MLGRSDQSIAAAGLLDLHARDDPRGRRCANRVRIEPKPIADRPGSGAAIAERKAHHPHRLARKQTDGNGDTAG